MEKYNSAPNPISYRIEYEKKLIIEHGLKDYFENQILIHTACGNLNLLTSPGRGNSCSSSYLFNYGITKVDPIKFNLKFEKFIHSDYRCIDIDIPHGKRDILIEEIKAVLPSNKALFEVLYHSKYPHIDFPESIVYAGIQYDIHPTAIIITDRGHNFSFDVCCIKEKTYLIVEESEKLHELIKFRHNIVSNKFLNTLSYLVEKTEVDLLNINLEDKDIFSYIKYGDTTDIFQLNSSEIVEALRISNINTFIEFVNIKSLCRTETFSLLSAYIENKENGDLIEIPSQLDLDTLLSETHGALIYSETLIDILNKYFGFSIDDSCKIEIEIRRSDSPHLNQIGELLRNRLKITSSLKNKEIDEICSYLMYWGRRTSSKSHMISYTLVSFWFAYFKVYHYQHFHNISKMGQL